MKTKKLLLLILCFMCVSLVMAQKQNPFTELQKDPKYNGVIDQDGTSRTIISTTDAEIQGSLCVGFDCIDNETYGFDTFRLKENNLRIHFNDTSNSASFPSNDWGIEINETVNGGANYFGIRDRTADRLSFRLDAGAPANSLRINNAGNIGFGTDTPIVEVHVADGDTPALRLEQNNSSGFTPQSWDMAGNETNFFIRDVSNGSTLPFRIRPGAPTSSIDIAATGSVGIGTSSPAADASLDLGGNTKGLLLNRLTTAERTAFTPSAAGMVVYDTEETLAYFWDGAAWQSSGTDDQGVDVFQLNAANELELSLEDDGAATQLVDLSGFLDNTDNQDIAGSGLTGTTLTIGISGGASEMVDLSSLSDSGSDDQLLSLTANTLALEDGGSVDLSGYLDNTDNQTLGNFIFNNNILGIALQNGGSVQVNLTPLIAPLQSDLDDAQVEIDNLNTQMADVLARLEAIEACACDGTLGINNANLKPEQPTLYQNIPNPFDNTTSIQYYIPFTYKTANIVVSATSGRIMENKNITKMGEGSITVNKARMQSAVYFYTLYVDGKRIDTKRMVVE